MLPVSNLLILVTIRMGLMDWGMISNILTELEIKFRTTAPRQEEVSACLQAADEMLACRRQLSGLQLSEDEQRQLDLACMRFADGAPTDEQLHSLRQDEQQHAVLQHTEAQLGGQSRVPLGKPGLLQLLFQCAV